MSACLSGGRLHGAVKGASCRVHGGSGAQGKLGEGFQGRQQLLGPGLQQGQPAAQLLPVACWLCTSGCTCYLLPYLSDMQMSLQFCEEARRGAGKELEDVASVAWCFGDISVLCGC